MTSKIKSTIFQRFLNIIERGGNALPHPATLFLLFALSTLVISWIGYLLGWQVAHPSTHEIIPVKNLLSLEGMRFILESTVTNFTDFAPLGIVLVAMLGIGIAEYSGLIGVVIRMLVLNSPKSMLTFVLVFSGIVSNAASDVGYVLLIHFLSILIILYGKLCILFHNFSWSFQLKSVFNNGCTFGMNPLS